MSEPNRAFRLTTEHDHTLDLDYHEWVDMGGDHVMRDFIGRKNGATYPWQPLRCNNFDCPGRAMYRGTLIEELAADWEADR